MDRRRVVGLFMLLLWSCPRPEGAVSPDVTATESLNPEQRRLRQSAAEVSADLQKWMSVVEDKLWAHWTQGAPLDLASAHSLRTFVDPKRRALVEQARAARADAPRALNHLFFAVERESIAEQLFSENQGLTSLEASLTFPFEGKDVRWNDLHRLLATEKSALKRKALWSASLSAAERLEAAYASRDAKWRSLVAPRTVVESLAAQNEIDLESMRRIAEGVLTLTSEAWRRSVERQNAQELKLPVGALTRADLPRLMRVAPEFELAFEKKTLPSRAIDLLSGLGLYGQPGLTLDLSEAAKKNPLPLTVAPKGPTDVRLSFRPLGGLRDQQQLFSELGVSLALRHVTERRFEYQRLGDQSLAAATGELFASLTSDSIWLATAGVDASAAVAIAEAAATQRLFALRKAAASFLVRVDCVEPNDAQARERAAAIWTRALLVTHTPADMARMRLDSDDAVRSALVIRAHLLGAALKEQLTKASGASFIRVSSTGPALAELWKPGSSVAAESRIASLGEGLESYVRLLGTSEPTRDGGTFGVWPRPLRIHPDSLVNPDLDAASPDSGETGDAGAWRVRDEVRWKPRPWPQPHLREGTSDAGVLGGKPLP
jgi:hypothetical protein